MSEKTNAPSQDSITAATDSSSDKAHALSPVDCFRPTETSGEDVKPDIGSLDTVFSPFQDATNGSITYEKHEWRGTWLRLGPLSGIFAFGVAIMSTTASLGVLAGSNRAIVDTWKTPPSTYIAIFTAIGNLAMRYAAIQGIIIAWWIKALRGSTVREMHYSWRAGTSFHGAIVAGRHMGWLGIASIFSCIVIILDGPLLQRSSTVTTTTDQGPPVKLQFSMVPEIPTDYSGAWIPTKSGGADIRWNLAFNDTVPSPKGDISNTIFAGGQNIFSPLVPLWAADKPLPSGVSGCSGKCTAQFTAPALAATTCVKYTKAVDYEAPWAIDNAFGMKHAPPLGHESFIIATALDVSENYEKINSITAYAPSTDCTGSINYSICSLESAVGVYNITIEDNQITIDSAAYPRIIGIANNTLVRRNPEPNGNRPSTLAGVVQAANLIWDSSVFTAKANGSTSVSANGANAGLLFQRGTYNESECPAFRDPRAEYTASLNKWMVFLGAAAAQGLANPRLNTLDPDLQINATTTGYVTGTRSVFDTDYAFFAGAAVVEFICICLIAPTYWGWWEIGRAVSFSPLEIAKAFEAPTLGHINSNSTGLQIAKSCNDQCIRYGSMNDSGEGTKLAFSRPDAVSRPRRGCLVDV